MAIYDIVSVKSDMEAALHGTTVNQITNIYGLFNRAARDIMDDCDPNETMRFGAPVPLHTGVFSYSCPADLKGNRIFDVRPQVNRKPWDSVMQLFSQNFDRVKNSILTGTLVNTKWNTYVKSLEIAVNQQPVLSLNTCDTFNGNGTWVAGAGASAVTTDNLNFVEGSGSVRFVLTGTGYVENSTMSSVSMTDLNPEGTLYLWFWLPSGTMSSVSLRWGSSSANYWTNTVTQAQDGTAFQVGWNLLAFDWQTATVVGSPSDSAVNYLRVTFNTADTMNPVRIDAVTSSLGTMFQIGYYSKYLFRDAVTGAFKETVTSDTDLLNLDTDSYQLFFNKCMILACQQKQGIDAIFADMPMFENAYADGLAKYQAKYPSQVQKTSLAYYKFNKQNYGKYVGRRFF